MQLKSAGSIRGLGITVVILSVVALLLCTLSFALIGITNAALGHGAFFDHLAYELSSELDYAYGYDHGFGYDDGHGIPVSIIGFILSVIGVIIVWEVLSCVVSLIAGIVAMRQANNIAKYGSIFSWSIAGAVAALLGGRLIAMGLLIVVAVFANKDKNAADTAQFNQGNVTFTQPGYAQTSVSQDPFYTAYGPGHAQPQAAPAQGVAVPPSYQQQPYPQTYPQPTPGYQQTYCQPMPAADAMPANAAAPAVEPAPENDAAPVIDVAPAVEAGAAQSPAADEHAAKAEPAAAKDEEVEGEQV